MRWLLLILSIQFEAFAGDTALKLWFRFDQTNNPTGASGAGYILDSSGSGNHGRQMNPTNWLFTTVFNGRQAGRWLTNEPPNNPNMTDAPEFPDGQIIPDESVPSTGHRYTGGVYLAVTNLNSIQRLTNFTVAFWAYHVHKEFNTATFIIDGAFSPSGQSWTNCWRLARVNADRLSLRVYKSSTSNSDGDALVQWPQDWISAANTGTDAWHHYAVTVDASGINEGSDPDPGAAGNRVVAYYDGALSSVGAVDCPPYFILHGFSLYDWAAVGCAAHDGSPQWGLVTPADKYPNDAFMHGALADIRIYNRELSAAEITAIHDGTADIEVRNHGNFTFTGTLE